MFAGLKAMATKQNGGHVFFQQDLFADAFSQPCAVCGAAFALPVRRGKGRPQRFCSDGCREIQIKNQKHAWAHRRAQSAANGSVK